MVLSAGGPPAPGESPRLDFLEIARVLSGEVVYPDSAAGVLGRLERRTNRLGYWGQAVRVRRAQPEVVVSLAEKVGMAVELMNGRRLRHVVIAHHLTSPRRQAFQRWTKWLHRVDHVIVLARPQARYLLDVVGLRDEQVHFIHDKVDHCFFEPQGGDDEGYILSVGRSRRDYTTLVEAVTPLRVPTIIVPSSPWLALGELGLRLPGHVQVARDLSYPALRQLYDRASLAVVPLQPETDFAAGVNAVLEAMAMATPLVVSQVPGLDDYLEDGVTARLVPPAQPEALRSTICELLADRQQARHLAAAGRAVVDQGRNLDRYVQAVAAVATG